jgi:hypothetical protein
MTQKIVSVVKDPDQKCIIQVDSKRHLKPILEESSQPSIKKADSESPNKSKDSETNSDHRRDINTSQLVKQISDKPREK